MDGVRVLLVRGIHADVILGVGGVLLGWGLVIKEVHVVVPAASERAYPPG